MRSPFSKPPTDENVSYEFRKWFESIKREFDFVALRRRVVSDAAYAVLQIDSLIAITALTAARTITLPDASMNEEKKFIVKDESGAATTWNITIACVLSQTIDGAATKVISTNYGLYRLYSNGVNYFTW